MTPLDYLLSWLVVATICGAFGGLAVLIERGLLAWERYWHTKNSFRASDGYERRWGSSDATAMHGDDEKC